MRKILAVMFAGFVMAVATPVQAEEEPYEESKRYIGASFLLSSPSFCGFDDYAPYDCIGSARFNGFPIAAEYQLTINDTISDAVGGYWTFCVNDYCPAILFDFCGSTTLYADPEFTIDVHLFDPAFNTLVCGGPAPPVEGTITMRQISE